MRAIVHAHAPALVSFSIARQIPDTSVLPQAAALCGPVGYAPYALTGSELLGERIAETFAAGHDIVILENHGAVAVGATLLQAFARLEALELAARTLIRAAALGEIPQYCGGRGGVGGGRRRADGGRARRAGQPRARTAATDR